MRGFGDSDDINYDLPRMAMATMHVQNAGVTFKPIKIHFYDGAGYAFVAYLDRIFDSRVNEAGVYEQ
jgi:hypothetical protein